MEPLRTRFLDLRWQKFPWQFVLKRHLPSSILISRVESRPATLVIVVCAHITARKTSEIAVDENQFKSFYVCLTLTVYLLGTHSAVGSVLELACCLFYQINFDC